MGIGTVLQNLLDKAGSNVNEVAQATGISPSTLYSIIRRDSMSANIEDLYKVAHYLGVSLDYFYINQHHGEGPSFSSEERELLCAFRQLDEFGKRLVRLVADEEVSRCKPVPASSQLSAPEATTSCLYLQLSEQPASAGTGVYLGPEAFRPIKVVANDKTCSAAFCVRVSGDSMEPIYRDGDIVMVSKEQPRNDDICLVTFDGCGYIKRIAPMKLISENKKYPPIPLNNDVIVNGRVIGKLWPDWILEM